MKAEQIFEKLMNSEEMQTSFGISETEAKAEQYAGQSSNPTIEIIKDVIRGIENRKNDNIVYSGIQKKRP